MRKVLQTIVRDTERYSISNSSELSLSKPDLYIEKIVLQGSETATTEDIVVTRSGKNLIKYPYYDAAEIVNGVTFIYNDDGSVTLKGTATTNAYRRISRNLQLDGGRYTLSGGTVGVIINCFKDNKWFGQSASSGDFSFTIADGGEILNTVTVYVNSGTTVDITIYPQIEKGNIATEYEPYLPPKSLTFSRDYLLSLKGVNNLLDKSKFPATQTRNGITFTNNGDGTITVNGTLIDNTVETYYVISGDIELDSTHKYLALGCPSGGSRTTFFMTDWSGIRYDIGNGIIFTNRNMSHNLQIRILTTVSNLVFKPQLYDLTAIYGEGNEPTTVEQFLKDYPLSSTDKLSITRQSVKYNDTDITSEITGLDEFFSIDADVSTITTSANIALGEITEDVSYSVKSNKRAVYTGEDVIYSSQTFIKE